MGIEELGSEMNDEAALDRQNALARSTIYDFLAALFTYHYGLEGVADRLGGKTPAVAAAAAVLQGRGYRLPVAEVLEMVQAAVGMEALTEIQAEYVALFDRPSTGHRLSPFESVQRHGIVNRGTIAALDEFYRRFGLALAPDAMETGDHCSVELAFMSFLAFQDAEAQRLGQDGEAFRQAQIDFLREHIMQWMPGWLERIEESTKHPYFRAAGGLARDVLAQDAEITGVGL